MADKSLSAMVLVSDLETLIKTLTINNAMLVFNDSKTKDAYFRACAAIAVARDMDDSEESGGQSEKFFDAMLKKHKPLKENLTGPVYALEPKKELEKEYKFKVKLPEGGGITAKSKGIKLLREVFGWSLLQAKAAVESEQLLTLKWENAPTLHKMAGQQGVEIIECN